MAYPKPYLEQRREMKLKGPAPKKVTREMAKAKGVYFAAQIDQAPQHCENCKKHLAGTKAINPAAIVCHILPKSPKTGVPSVALHPKNRWFGCGDCHTDYDNKGAKFVQSMAIFPVLKERVADLWQDIEPAERRRVPAYFKPGK